MNEELKQLIESTGLTKAKIAQIAGVVPSTVSRWCSGAVAVPPLLIERLREIDQTINKTKKN